MTKLISDVNAHIEGERDGKLITLRVSCGHLFYLIVMFFLVTTS